MKKAYFIPVLLLFVAIFSSCSTKVDLYADYKDIPVVYGLLDSSQDTNFIRINRAFSGSNDHPINANEVALIADSCNYPGKLDARLIELKSTNGDKYEPTGRVLMLDTLTIHDKVEGVFIHPTRWSITRLSVLWPGQVVKDSAIGLWLSNPMATRFWGGQPWSEMRNSA